MNIPRIFDDSGELVEIDVSELDAANPVRVRYEAVRDAFKANTDAEANLTAAFAEVQDALAAVESAETFHDAHWPRQNFMDLWRENFAGGPANTKRARGIK